MNLEIELPNFMTPLMKQWLKQYKVGKLNKITDLGLFHWDFRPNKRKLEKPRRIPRIDENVELKDLSFKHAVYFLEIDSKTLHVYESSGSSLGGLNIAHEYAIEEKVFIKGKILMKSIR